MKNSNNLYPAFFKKNRNTLKSAVDKNLPIIITANSFMQKSADAVYPFVQDSNFWYLTGIDEPGIILVIEPKNEYLILPKVEPARERFDGAISTDYLCKTSGIETIYSSEQGWDQLKKTITKSRSIASIQSPQEFIEPLEMFTNPSRHRLISRLQDVKNDVNIFDIKDSLVNMRSVKQPAEIKLIKNALFHTHKLFKQLELERLKAKSESDLMAEIFKYNLKYATETAYDPIIASGSNALTLHYSANNSKIDRENFLLVDAALKSSKYNADITRTVSSSPTKRQQQVYDAVLAVHGYALSLLKPGLDLVSYEISVNNFMGEKLRELGLIKSISDEAMREFYPHRTSHFLGIDVHDVGDYGLPLQRGMVLTVEPGIYIKEESIGVRLEDTILITASGAKNLSDDIPKLIDKLA